MYGWIWRHLPGPLVARVITAVLLVLGMITLLMLVIFPWLEPVLPFIVVTTQ